ncbi:MAG: hypothetical protein QXR89_08805 [Candidatus Bathyarchaeia archaeon]
MDRFPEAFQRFEQVVDVSKIRSFKELLSAFKLWAGRKWVDSPLQLAALKEEAFKREIPQIPVSREEWLREKEEVDRFYRRVYYTWQRYVYNQNVWKRLTAERFRARGKRRVELEARIKEAEERMRFWRQTWETNFHHLKLAHSRFRLKVVEEVKVRD